MAKKFHSCDRLLWFRTPLPQEAVLLLVMGLRMEAQPEPKVSPRVSACWHWLPCSHLSWRQGCSLGNLAGRSQLPFLCCPRAVPVWRRGGVFLLGAQSRDKGKPIKLQARGSENFLPQKIQVTLASAPWQLEVPHKVLACLGRVLCFHSLPDARLALHGTRFRETGCVLGGRTVTTLGQMSA